MKTPLTFREATPSPIARFESGVCVVRGRMHIIGGHHGEALDVTDVHWAYDPATDTWERRADQPEPVSHYTCQVEDDRFVWYTGGYLGKHPGVAVNKTWRYDAQDDAWQEFAPLPALRASLGCAILDGRMHVWGGLGEDRNTNFDDHWVLDLANPAAWQPAAPMPEARAHFATGVVGGKAYAIGGHFFHDAPNQARGQSCADLDFLHRYDPESDTWQRMNDLPFRRSHIETATMHYQGKLVVVGGRNNSPDALPARLRNSPRMIPVKAFRKVRRMLNPPTESTMGRVSLDHVSLYDPPTDSWKQIGTLPKPLYACAAAIVGHTLVVTNGGLRAWKDASAHTWVASLV